MPRIVEYDAKDTKLTPLGEGETAWTGAGRRIGPAYNEAATLIRESQKGLVEGAQDIASAAGLNVKGAKNIVAAAGEQVRGAENVTKAYGDVAKQGENVVKAAGENVAAGKAQGQAQMLQADQIEKLEKAFLSQYKDLFDIGETGAATKSRGGGGGGFRTKGGNSDPFGIMSNQFQNPYGAADEILNGAHALTKKLSGTDLDAYRARQFPSIGGDTTGNPKFTSPTDLDPANSPKGQVQRDIASSPEAGGQMLGGGAAAGASGAPGGAPDTSNEPADPNMAEYWRQYLGGSGPPVPGSYGDPTHPPTPTAPNWAQQFFGSDTTAGTSGAATDTGGEG